jgi:4-methyl-5(b-hydroxyethyl)-thiazole monophosphate biosynthesis
MTGEDNKIKKVCLFLADGCEMVEALTVVDLLRRAGIPVTTVSVNGKKEIVSSHRVSIRADEDIANFSFADYDMIILPGGQPGTKNLRANVPLAQAILNFAEEGKALAAICAAPTILAGLELLNGKRATCFPGCETGMGKAVLTNEAVTTDGNIITGRSVGCAIPFALEIIRHYLGPEAAEEIRKTIVYEVRQ